MNLDEKYQRISSLKYSLIFKKQKIVVMKGMKGYNEKQSKIVSI